MWNKSSRLSGTVVRIFAMAASMALLAGCASTISARVTSFQQWPSDASGQDYRIVPAANQVNNLEFESIADTVRAAIGPTGLVRSEEHTSELQSLMRISYAVFCLKKKNSNNN